VKLEMDVLHVTSPRGVKKSVAGADDHRRTVAVNEANTAVMRRLRCDELGDASGFGIRMRAPKRWQTKERSAWRSGLVET
jgi:hypothetical protein